MPSIKRIEDKDKIPIVEVKDEYAKSFVKFRRSLIMKIINDTNEPLCSLVYMTLLSHKNKDDDYSYPSMEKLKKELNIGRTNILKYITLLYNYGYIDIKKEKVGGSNQYYFELEKNIIKKEKELNKEKKQEQNYNILNTETNPFEQQ